MNELYFRWLCKQVYTKRRPEKDYSLLMQHLHKVPFHYILELDENRAADGISLRYRFGCSHGYSQEEIMQIDDHDDCSMLEMLVALSLRCEEDIMGDPTKIKVYKWFWVMLENCGLAVFTNEFYNEKKVDTIIHRVLYREYEMNGEGGLFPLPGTNCDLRLVDVWYQLNWYLNYITRGEIRMC